jgi:DNA-directed RNA polymerase subunit K/omega
MTKYERARILGTRALQIRYVRPGKEEIIYRRMLTDLGLA